MFCICIPVCLCMMKRWCCGVWQTGSSEVTGGKLMCKTVWAAEWNRGDSSQNDVWCVIGADAICSAHRLLPSFSLIPLRPSAGSFSSSRFSYVHFHTAHPLLFDHYTSLFAPLFHCNRLFLLHAPSQSVRPAPVSKGVTTTKEHGECCGAGGMNGRWSMA